MGGISRAYRYTKTWRCWRVPQMELFDQTSLLQARRAKTSAWQERVRDWMGSAPDSSTASSVSGIQALPAGASGKMSPGPCGETRGEISAYAWRGSPDTDPKCHLVVGKPSDGVSDREGGVCGACVNVWSYARTLTCTLTRLRAHTHAHGLTCSPHPRATLPRTHTLTHALTHTSTQARMHA